MSIKPILGYNRHNSFRVIASFGYWFQFPVKPLADIQSSSLQHLTFSLWYIARNRSWKGEFPHQISFQNRIFKPRPGISLNNVFQSILISSMWRIALCMLHHMSVDVFLAMYVASFFYRDEQRNRPAETGLNRTRPGNRSWPKLRIEPDHRFYQFPVLTVSSMLEPVIKK